MPLPQSWADALIARLAVRYGAAFMRQYGDADAATVKADWAEVLGGVRGDAIAYALQYLPADRPPTALQFRDLCLRAPAPAAPRLPGPQPDAPPARIRQLAAGTRPSGANPAQQCLDNIARAVVAGGVGVSPAQRHVAEHCLRMPGTTLPPALAADPRFAAWVAGREGSSPAQIAPLLDDRGPGKGAVATAAENAASGRKSAVPGECRPEGATATVEGGTA